MNNKQMPILAIAAASILLGGCVGIPIAVPEAQPFKEVVNEKFVVGQTANADVAETLGDPSITHQDRWIYEDSRDGWAWLFCWGMYYSGGCGTTERTSKDYFLLADFDDTGKLSYVDVLSRGELCDEQNVCVRNLQVMKSATAAEDEKRKLFAEPVTGCTAYIYSDEGSDEVAGPIEINGRRMGSIVRDLGYHAFDLPPGRHQISIAPVGELHLNSIGVHGFDCNEPRLLFLRYTSEFFSAKLIEEPAEIAQQEIRARWLAEPEPAETAADVNTAWLRDGEVLVVTDGDTVKAIHDGTGRKRTGWGVRRDNEPCGMGMVMEDYDLTPAGGRRDINFSDRDHKDVRVIPVCDRAGECTFPSVFEGYECKTWQDERISYIKWQKLLVIEPADDGYREVFFGHSKQLKKYSWCKGTECHISLATLRNEVDTASP